MRSTSPTTVSSSPATGTSALSTKGWTETSSLGRIVMSRPSLVSGYSSAKAMEKASTASRACSTVTPGRRRPLANRFRVLRRSNRLPDTNSSSSDIIMGT